MEISEKEYRKIMAENEQLRIEKIQGNNRRRSFYNLPKKFGGLEISFDFFSKFSSNNWKNLFGDVKVIQARVDIFRGVVSYFCWHESFEEIKERVFDRIPIYNIEIKIIKNEIIRSVPGFIKTDKYLTW